MYMKDIMSLKKIPFGVQKLSPGDVYTFKIQSLE